MNKGKSIAEIHKDCVACGTCVKVCPRSALSVFKGVGVVVDREKCIGCGKCAKVCPAGVISIVGGASE
ncbi:MAG: Ferredoxin-2 [Candidatus Dichloromethanomonas elyunquensis]|nr:MAG: Ferredoxin-2 [Candidatus Dichloromethanomonas elyunquensis]